MADMVVEKTEEELATAPLDPMADMVAAYVKAKELEKQAKERAEFYRAEIASYLEDKGAEYGTIKGKVAIRWRTVISNRFDTKSFRKDQKELAEAYTVASESQRMEIVDND